MNLILTTLFTVSFASIDPDLFDSSDILPNHNRSEPCNDPRSKSEIPISQRRSFPSNSQDRWPRSTDYNDYPNPGYLNSRSNLIPRTRNQGPSECIESTCVTKMLRALGVPVDLIKNLKELACDTVISKIKPTPAIENAIRDAVNQANLEALANRLDELMPDKQTPNSALQNRLGVITPEDVVKSIKLLSEPDLIKCSKSHAWCWALIKDVVVNTGRYGAEKPGVSAEDVQAIARADLAIDGALQAAEQAVGPAHDLGKCVKEFTWCHQRTAQFFASLQ